MPIYKVKLKSKKEIAAETMAFYFEKPKGFVYKARKSTITEKTTRARSSCRGKQ